jgi:hypothetical protein
MFSLSDGPTALRADWVHGLSFSVGTVMLEGEGDPQRAVAALGGIWNGTKGYVVFLVRWLDTPVLQRFSYSEALLSLETVIGAVDEGLGFAESMGFVMEPFDFLDLRPEQQKQRLEAWDDVRKLDRTPAAANESTGSPLLRGKQVLARVPVISRESECAPPASRLRAQF